MAGIARKFKRDHSSSSSSFSDFPLYDFYEKVSDLGSGSQGNVEEYKLMEGKNGTQDLPPRVAVKTFKKSSKPWEESRPKSSGHEVLMSFQHERLIRVFGILERENKTVVVMELADGSLEDFLTQRKPNMMEAACIIFQILEGLLSLHKRKIMHRDLKPSNILINSKGGRSAWKTIDMHEISVKIADYDFVRRFANESPGQTASKSVVGTLRYMAPEIWGQYKVSNSAYYTESADVYALGVMCWEIFKGFEGLRSKTPDLAGTSLLNFILLQINPDKRKHKSASKLLKHPFLGIYGQLLLDKHKCAKEWKAMRKSNASLSKEIERLENELKAAKEEVTSQKAILKDVKRNNDDLKQKYKITSEQASSYHNALNTVLWIVSARGEEISAREALKGRANVDWTDPEYGATPLVVAAQEGHYDIVSMLIDGGANINAQSENGVTGLMVSSGQGHSRCVELLIDKGADLELKASPGGKALTIAAERGKIECIKLLLEGGVEVNARDSHEQTALMMAALDGHTKCVELLLERGGQVNIESNNGGTALICAIEDGHLKCAELLLDKGADINAKLNNAVTALILATQNDKVMCTKLLLDRGADIDAADENGFTATMIAAESGYLGCLATLLTHGAEINAKTNDGINALMLTAQKGQVACMKLLIEAGMNVNRTSQNGFSALMFAARDGQVDCLTLLIDKGADINVKNEKGYTALMLASYNDHFDCASVLLNRRAEVNARNNHNSSSLTLAAECNNGPDIISLLLKRGAELEHKDADEGTALMCAVYGGKLKIVKHLVEEWNADLTTKMKKMDNKQSLLAVAQKKGWDDIFDYLKLKGVKS